MLHVEQVGRVLLVAPTQCSAYNNCLVGSSIALLFLLFLSKPWFHAGLGIVPAVDGVDLTC